MFILNKSIVKNIYSTIKLSSFMLKVECLDLNSMTKLMTIKMDRRDIYLKNI